MVHAIFLQTDLLCTYRCSVTEVSQKTGGMDGRHRFLIKLYTERSLLSENWRLRKQFEFFVTVGKLGFILK